MDTSEEAAAALSIYLDYMYSAFVSATRDREGAGLSPEGFAAVSIEMP